MKFIYPEFLFALIALFIPIIIHLFNFKKFRLVYFSSTRFLKEINLQTQNRSKLKHILVLILRILALSFLVFAFAQPYVPGTNIDEAKGQKVISIYIDNSFSMQAKGKQGELLAIAKEKAYQIARQYNSTDRFQLLTNDFFAWQQRLYSREEFIELLKQIEYSSNTVYFSDVILRQNDLLNQFTESNKRWIWISDFQSSVCNFDEIKDFQGRLVCIPLEAENQRNISIDSVWFDAPARQLNGKEIIHVRVKNYSDKDIENIALKLEINGAVKSVSSIHVSANSYADSSLQFVNIQKGIQHAKISLNDFQVTYDDQYYFSYQVSDNINILCINPDNTKDTSTYFSKLFKSDMYFKFKQINQSAINYSALGQYNLIILNQLPVINSGLANEINKNIKNGVHCLFFPAVNSNLETYNRFLNIHSAGMFQKPDTHSYKLKMIDYSIPFFVGIFEKENKTMDMPRVNYHYVQDSYNTLKKEKILEIQNNESFLCRYPVSKGYLYVCSSPLNDKTNNFGRHALFVPVILRIAEWSVNQLPISYVISPNNNVEFPDLGYSLEGGFELNSLSGESFVPEVSKIPPLINLNTHNQIKQAGNYNILYEKKPIYGVSYNYNRLESESKCLSRAELEKKLNNSGINNYSIAGIKEINNNINIELIDNSFYYWKICIILALLFLISEIILLRFWKV